MRPRGASARLARPPIRAALFQRNRRRAAYSRPTSAPSGDPELDRYETKAAAFWMASTLNALAIYDYLQT